MAGKTRWSNQFSGHLPFTDKWLSIHGCAEESVTGSRVKYCRRAPTSIGHKWTVHTKSVYIDCLYRNNFYVTFLLSHVNHRRRKR